MKSSTFKLNVTFLTPVLGSQPTRAIASEFIAEKNGIKLPEDEAETLPEALERGTTVFHRANDGGPLLYDYHIKGFLKEAARVFNGKVTEGTKALKSKVASTVFISPRQIPLRLPTGEALDYLERPLRAETAQGPRVALARSEMVPEGTTFSCGIEILEGEINEKTLRELLDYGYYNGIGQWRGGGHGRFRYELICEDTEPEEEAAAAAAAKEAPKTRGPKAKAKA